MQISPGPWLLRPLLVLLVVLGAGCAQLFIAADDVPLRTPDGYYPPAEWRTATPEAQGIDSEVLVALFDAVEERRLPIHSLHIVRYGHLVSAAF